MVSVVLQFDPPDGSIFIWAGLPRFTPTFTPDPGGLFRSDDSANFEEPAFRGRVSSQRVTRIGCALEAEQVFVQPT